MVGNLYTCTATVTDLKNLGLEKVVGDHQDGKSNDDVEFLKVDDQNLPFIPEGIAGFFKNLKALKVYNSNLMSISGKDLKQFPQLILLDLYWSGNLETLDGDLFSFTPLLQHVDFGRNLIQHIGEDLLTNSPNLTYIDLVRNGCVDRLAPTRSKVLELSAQLPLLCPLPQKCSCDEEIDNLRAENRQQSEKIKELVHAVKYLRESNADLEKRILDVDKQSKGSSSAIHANLLVILLVSLSYVLK